ncbi:ATPase [Pseudomonas sp. TUM22785]|uniref:ATPase n=1 Tax=Pseudomonas sp. TUM22785 TaxID=3019098 RepID=UPI002304F471|nr:ATPase [Pseudomonas sp. TUM22785]WCD77764.1 ATPase [Pseudomonas sp. TUM22785]
MPTKAPITRAYCVQLDEVLSIAEARRAFFSLPEPRSRFDFLCSSEACRTLGTKVTAANYDKQPNETYKAAHFRENPHSSHAPDCEWMADEEDEDAEGKLPGESEAEARQRHARRKLHDYIDVFEPPVERARPSADKPDTPTAPARKPTGTPDEAPAPRNEKKSVNQRTSSLERLVECYRQARLELGNDEFKAMRLRVVGEGEMPLGAYFKAIKYAKLGTANRVLQGGALLVDRYGSGFKLKFYDRIDNKPVFLYISKEQMDAYRFKGYLDGLLREEVDYFRVFAMGELALSPSGKSLDLKVADLRQLVLIPGIKKAPATEA